jgi:hypothetical protein
MIQMPTYTQRQYGADFCPRCRGQGHYVEDGAKFCVLCNQPIRAEAKTPPPATGKKKTVAQRTQEWAAVTHCYHGHEFTEANTYVDPNGRKRCRRCSRELTRTWRAKQGRR